MWGDDRLFSHTYDTPTRTVQGIHTGGCAVVYRGHRHLWWSGGQCNRMVFGPLPHPPVAVDPDQLGMIMCVTRQHFGLEHVHHHAPQLIVLSLIPGYNLYLLPFLLMVERPMQRCLPHLHPRIIKLIWRSFVVIVLGVIGAILPFFSSFVSLVYVGGVFGKYHDRTLAHIAPQIHTQGRHRICTCNMSLSHTFHTHTSFAHQPLSIHTVAHINLLSLGNVDRPVQAIPSCTNSAADCEYICFDCNSGGSGRFSGEHSGECLDLYVWLGLGLCSVCIHIDLHE